MNALEPSRLADLTFAGGDLAGPATVDVTGSLASYSGQMSGSGSTVLLSGATASVEGFSLEEARSFVNEGTAQLRSGSLTIDESAQLRNTGTFKVGVVGSSTELRGSTGGPGVVNTGLFEKVEGTERTEVALNFENRGTLNAESGPLRFDTGAFVTLGNSTIQRNIENYGTLSGENVDATNATLGLADGSFSVVAGKTARIKNLSFEAASGVLTGAGTVDVTGSLSTESGVMEGSESLVLLPGAAATLRDFWLEESSTFVNEGTATFESPGVIFMLNAAQIVNVGAFYANSESYAAEIRAFEGSPLFVNLGRFEKTAGTGTTTVGVEFENLGSVSEPTGGLSFEDPVAEVAETWGGEENPSTPSQELAMCGESVSCGGNYSITESDFAIGGRGVGLSMERTYNSQAATSGAHGVFGYGWSSSFSDHLMLESTHHLATLVQANGSTVPFTESGGGAFTAPAWTQDTLSGTASTGFTLTLADQTVYRFAGATGRLESVTDRNGNATTIAYNGSGNPETITDPAGRTLKLAYNAEGLVSTVTDPMNHVVKYTYEAGNLASVTQPGELALRWQFKYNEAHELTELTDGRGGKTVNAYNSAKQVT